MGSLHVRWLRSSGEEARESGTRESRDDAVRSWKSMGKTMSLVQQGSQTARNRKPPMATNVGAETPAPMAMVMWKREALVLSSTCPAWGRGVLGTLAPRAIPRRAAGCTIHQLSMQPTWAARCGSRSSHSPK
jgi:hypothetical protein